MTEEGIRLNPVQEFKVIQGVDGKKTKREPQLSDYFR
jgi:hypothetical protein